MAPLENDLIMSGTSIQSFRHLEHQNPSIISEYIGRMNVGCKICDTRTEQGTQNNSGIILDEYSATIIYSTD